MEDEVSIIPYRNIPFDIGRKIDDRLHGLIRDYLVKHENYAEMSVDDLLKKLSGDILFAFQILPNMRLYIYRFGIGVFTIKDSEQLFSKDTYAAEYCNMRKASHEAYLTISNEYSKLMYRIAECLRSLVGLNKSKLRVSAGNTWENNGFSYVMTVSCVFQSTGNFTYRKMNDKEKKSLHIMLEPSIIHAEDSMVYSSDILSSPNNVNDIDLSSLEEPKDWIRSSDFSIYISWAAVLLYSSSRETMGFTALEILEVDLQAMWLYTYCMYENLKNYSADHKILVSELRKELYKFNRKYNEFKNIDDSSAPAYITRLRSELIRTSGIEDYATKYIEYIEYCIVETESINTEKQKKYSWLNEILLFIIAFVQVAPMCYEFMTGGYQDIQLGSALLMIAFVIFAIVIIILKN